MAKLKFNITTSSSASSFLSTVEQSLIDANTALKEYYRGLPTKDEVESHVRRISKEIDDYGNEIDNLTTVNYNYYMNNYGNYLINSRTNLLRMSAATSVVESNIVDVEEKIKGMEGAVDDYEGTQVDDEEISDVSYLDIPAEVPVDRDDLNGVGDNGGSGNGGTGGGPGGGGPGGGDGSENDWDIDISENPNLFPDPSEEDDPGSSDPLIGVPPVIGPNIDDPEIGDPKVDDPSNNDEPRNPNIDIDTNDDGVPDVNVDPDKDGDADINIDINNDLIPDINIDTDNDKHADLNIDLNGDGIPDVNVDTDGDGIPDKNVIIGYEHNYGDKEKGSFIDDLLNKMKLEVDSEGNVLYHDENGNVVYPFLGDGVFINPETGQKFKLGENAFLELLDKPQKGQAVSPIHIAADEEVSSATFAIGGMAAVGAAAANAAANMKRTKDEIKDGYRSYDYDYDYDDDAILTGDQYKKRKTGTIVSMVLLTILIIANAVALILDITSDVTVVLLGLAISITAIITSMGIKFGKFYTIGAILVNLLIVFIISSLGLTGYLGYVIAYAVIIVVLLYYYFTKLFERILPMFNYVPAVVAIVGIGFVGLASVFAVTNWWVSLILVVLILIGYFAYNYFGIAKLEEQMELEKQKGLSVYDYFNLKTNRVQWNAGNKPSQNNASGNKFVNKEPEEDSNDLKNFFK